MVVANIRSPVLSSDLRYYMWLYTQHLDSIATILIEFLLSNSIQYGDSFNIILQKIVWAQKIQYQGKGYWGWLMVNLTDSDKIPRVPCSMIQAATYIIPMTTTSTIYVTATSQIGAVFIWIVIAWLVGSPVGEDDTFSGGLKFPVALWIFVSDTWSGQDKDQNQGSVPRIKVLDPWFKD